MLSPPACRCVLWILPLANSSSFRLQLSFRCGGLNSAHASLNTGLVFAHLAVISMIVSDFFAVFAIGLLRRFLYPILDPLAFVPNTFYAHNLSKYGLFQSLSQYGLFQNPGLHTYFGLNLNRGLNKTDVFASRPSFTQELLYTNKSRVIHKHHVLHKNHVLAGPVQGLFAAYRIALSMVAGGTRRRRLNTKWVERFMTGSRKARYSKFRPTRADSGRLDVTEAVTLLWCK